MSQSSIVPLIGSAGCQSGGSQWLDFLKRWTRGGCCLSNYLLYFPYQCLKWSWRRVLRAHAKTRRNCGEMICLVAANNASLGIDLKSQNTLCLFLSR